MADGPVTGIDVIAESEQVYRALSLAHFQDGLPTYACFDLRKNHSLEQGPSHLLASEIPENQLSRFRPFYPEKSLRITLFVSELIQPVRTQHVVVVRVPDAFFEEYANTHCVLTGYQALTNRELTNFRRYLLNLAISKVREIRPASPSTTS